MIAARALDFFFRAGPAVFFTASVGFPWSIISISENVETQLGFSVQQVLSDPDFLVESIHPDDHDQLNKDAEAVTHNGRVPFLYKMRKLEGTYILVQGEFCLLHDDQGIPEAIIGYWTDCTERERTRALLLAIPDAMFEADQDGRFTFFQATEWQTTVDPSMIVGATMHELLPKDVADLLLNATRRALASKQPQVVKYAVPMGSGWRHCQARIGTSLSHDMVVAVVRDITEEVSYETDLVTQKRFLEEANVSLEQFVFVASHDLREPLTGIAGFASLLQKRYGSALDETGQHFVEGIVNSAQDLATKIDDLLALSRVSRGTYSGSFPLGAAIDSAKRCLVGQISKTQVEFRLPDVLPIVRGDRGQITQVFQNLFSNSIKYQRLDGPTIIEVAVQDDSTPGMLLVSVKDNGIGFDRKHAERIFGVFQRLYTMQQYPGTGIGLAIVKKIVERHGGRVFAESDPNAGATFFFSIPKA